MKTYLQSTLLLAALSLSIHLSAQNSGCVQCNGCTASGNNASAIGNNNTASGNNSFAGGYNSQATGSNSMAFGYNSKATQSTNIALGNTAEASGIGSMALGTYVKASGQSTLAIGTGSTAGYPLTNNTPYSIAFGINSNKPTMLITKSLNNNYTGKVGIGQVTSPQTKLHVKADSNEDAGLFLEPSNKSTRKAFLRLFDSDHAITVDKNLAMQLQAGNGSIEFLGDHYCFGKASEAKTRLYTNGTPSLYYNVKRNKNTEVRDQEQSSYAIDFSDDALRFRTATQQSPRGAEITNWSNAMTLNTDGRITLNGKVGINTENKVEGYALAVDGGLITTKVFIKEAHLWPDHVFDNDYPMMELDMLRDYVADHKHLPGVPSESEVLGQGYDLHEMQFILLEKIEEMTRYILQLQEEIDHLKSGRPQDHKTVQFSYDENGNRIARNLLFKRIQEPNGDLSSPSMLSYELFPNPTPDWFSLQLKDGMDEAQLRATLFTLSGIQLEEKTIEGRQMEFDLSPYPNGVYLLEVQGAEGKQSWKIIKR